MAISRFRAQLHGKSSGSKQNASRDMRRVVEQFRRWTRHVDEQMLPVLLWALQPTFQKSQDYTPKKYGDLRKSGYLEGRKYRGNAVIEIGYGKDDYPSYAPYVHERVDLRHKPPTRAKFLQAALEEDAAEVQRRIVRGLKIAGGTD